MLIPLLVISVIGFIYRLWFTTLPLSSGDWPYLFAENIKEFSFFPETRFLWLAPYYQILTKFVVQYGNIPWEIAEKLLWFLPFVAISIFASFKAFRSWMSVLIYTTNTYILMIVGGGQMGVALAYALAPIVIKRFIDSSEDFFHIEKIKNQKSKIKNIFLTGIILAIQTMFDPRIALLTTVAAFIVLLLDSSRRAILMTRWKTVIVGAFGIALFVLTLHFYWIIPLIRTHAAVISRQLSEVSTQSLKFLSFATFEQTLSLLHPNWPENIFGKVYFMQPEFLILPIFAFSIFIFADQKQKKLALPFGLLALVGAFLAKGTQEPFGGVYAWLFTYVPGFWLFRDPTKFYLFIALAYAYLIAGSIASVKAKRILSIVFIIVWAFTIRQAVTHELGGTFTPRPVNPEYIKFKDLLVSSPDGAATYWIPAIHRFSFSSETHPAYAVDIDSLTTATVSGYIVVPNDTHREIFLTDRVYDDTLRQQTIKTIDNLPGLKRDTAFEALAIWRKE